MEDKNIKELSIELDKLIEDFNSQLSTLVVDPKGFHDSLIDLVAKYPNEKELIQFIVYINDRLETNHLLFTGLISDSFNDMLNIKKRTLVELQEIQEMNIVNINSTPTLKWWEGALYKIRNFKDVKIILIGIVIIVVSIAVMVDASHLLLAIEAIAKLW